jgi:flagellar motor switch protein FliG
VSENDEATGDARRVLKLLELHRRHHRESVRITRGLAERVRGQVESLLAEAGEQAAESRPTADAPPTQRSGASGPWPALEAAASLARDLPGRLRSAIANKLPPELEEQFLEALYSFDALPALDGRTIEAIVRRTDKRTLATALLGAPDAHFHAVTGNMSRRAAEMLREDMESLLAAGELSTRDVHDARSALSSIIRSEAGGGQ